MVRENSKLISKVFEALRADKVPVADLAKAVHIFPEELNHYVFGLAPIGFKGGEQKTAHARPALSLVR
ncbi:hypothetical protein [Streptomyces sp. gb1(2016)]|uniref:Uncharacterized protein n=1 Tax=Streptomyces sp. gb1(2016) TaxID=1828321 RepID=A0A652LAI4_9ACTN|nr:hypothetical protein [Streptomyces sp. gb1(2016)]TXS32797.1 hypothetical protein EAO74_05505 [Streptomyces sp. gb1(2016)]